MQYDSYVQKSVLLRHTHAKNVFPGDFLIPRENESETLLTITGTLRSHVNKSSALFNFLYTNWKIKWHNTRMIMKWQKKLFYTVGSIFHSRSFNIVKLQPYQSKNVSIVLNYFNCITIPLALNLWKLSHWTALMRNTCNKHWHASFSHLYWHLGLQQYTGISVNIAIRNPHIVLRYDFHHTGTKILQKLIHISSRKAIRNNDKKVNKTKQCKLFFT